MPIQTGSRGATIAGVSYPPYQYLDGLAPDVEAVAVQGGDASYVPRRTLTPGEREAALRDLYGRPSLPLPLCDWQTNGVLTLASANGGGEAIALDPAVTFEGQPMLRCTLSSGTFIANFELTTAVPAAKLRTLQLPIRFSSNAGFVAGSNDLQVWLYDSTLAKRWQPQIPLATHQPGVTTVINVAAGAANQGWTFSGGPANSSELDNELVKRVRVVLAVPAGAAGVQIWVGPLRVNTRGPRGVICWTMDGQYPSQNNYVLPMLESYGIRASLASVFSTIGTGGLMTAAQIDRWYANGHEVIHHTFDGSKTGGYANVGQWANSAAIQADYEAGLAYMRTRGWTRCTASATPSTRRSRPRGRQRSWRPCRVPGSSRCASRCPCTSAASRSRGPRGWRPTACRVAGSSHRPLSRPMWPRPSTARHAKAT